MFWSGHGKHEVMSPGPCVSRKVPEGQAEKNFKSVMNILFDFLMSLNSYIIREWLDFLKIIDKPIYFYY